MTVAHYRLLRKKLIRLAPTSGLGRFTLYLLLVDVLLYALKKVFTRIAPRWASGALDTWLLLLSAALVVLGLVLGLRWLRRSFMWRLRNRLIVTYMFIGVIPLALVVAMAVVAGYLFAGQFATFLVTSDLQSELNSLGAANSTVTAELATMARRGGITLDQAIPALQGVHPGDRRFVNTEITAWHRGKSHDLHRPPGRSTPPLSKPQWMPDRFRGIVLENQSLHLRAADTLPVNGERLTVISSLPLDQGLLQHIAGNSGEITLYLTSAVRIDGGERRPGGRRRASEPDLVGSVSGGTLPARSRALDREVAFATPFTVVNWQTGEGVTAILRVSTRFSLLYGRLFVTMVEFGSVIKGLLIGIAILFAVIEFIALLIGVGLTRTMTRSVAELYEATQHINRGDLKHRITVQARDQLAALESAFNSMSESLEKLIAEQKEKQRLENELAIAQEVQAQLFPRASSDLETLEVHGLCRPARTVSGDYYDFLPLGPDRLGIAVGDISGKGISAALLMATIHSAVRAYEFGRMPRMRAHLVAAGAQDDGATHVFDVASGPQDLEFSPANVMALLNRQLFHSTPPEKYATLFLAIYDGKARTLTYSNAGHLPPIVMGQDGSLRRLDTPGLVIGLFDHQTYEAHTIELRPGDIFLAFSDGVTEPENEFGEFGEERLIEMVRDLRHLPLARISELVAAAVSDWIGSAEQPDDVTLVLARVR